MVLLVVVKSTLIALVVRAYGPSWRTAWAVGMTMGHVGEFAFILLSMAAQLKIVTSQDRIGLGYIAVPAYKGSLAEAKRCLQQI
eukprot:1160957-Pelagomonas_calceolata.AAC.4